MSKSELKGNSGTFIPYTFTRTVGLLHFRQLKQSSIIMSYSNMRYRIDKEREQLHGPTVAESVGKSALYVQEMSRFGPGRTTPEMNR